GLHRHRRHRLGQQRQPVHQRRVPRGHLRRDRPLGLQDQLRDLSVAARGAIHRATSLGLSAQGFVAETCSTSSTAAFRLRALDENPGARSRDGLRHGLLGSGLRPRCVIPRRTRYTAAVSFFDPQSDPRTGWRARVYDVIFETDTRAGRLFDIALLSAILLSVIVIALETVGSLAPAQRRVLRVIEWILTGLFTVEYILRLIVVRQPRRYALSFMGIIDLISLVPTYLSLAFADA